MKKFLVLYLAPVSVLEEWMKTDATHREEAEAKMRMEWDSWVSKHKSMLTGVTAGAGKNKRVTADGVADIKNDVMLYSMVEAQSQEEVAAAFAQHPHFGIPGAWIDIMPINPLPGLEGM